ncbi:hypothetical protein PR202_ga30914 [Eleusine coracana subsp. coracana]|uniref:Uncharacterized protein n=1 Tax=Eleusine coracana subsp. coracana TaxID=191504 RepID=A0AAV5DR11_ELECO|nr:hypothetical protein PR202_ga30914 [Eleusine coracana subsp. coracana]
MCKFLVDGGQPSCGQYPPLDQHLTVQIESLSAFPFFTVTFRRDSLRWLLAPPCRSRLAGGDAASSSLKAAALSLHDPHPLPPHRRICGRREHLVPANSPFPYTP